MEPVTPTAGLASQCPAVPGNPINALSPGLTGGYIYNPNDAPGFLYVDPTGPASTVANGTSMALAPGQAFYAIPASTIPVSVASNIASHYFVSVQWI
ncbi:MAG TPA: hypothetical protein VK890_07980 [Bacteroidia bacterium]|jgi:hypothetical protein|nr:hypothetical protein [Bacteroidia bacterium]